MSSLLFLLQLMKPPPPPVYTFPPNPPPPFQFLFFDGAGLFSLLSYWIIITSWATILLLLAVLAFFLLGTSRRKSAWWQYLALLLVGGIGLYSIVVVYNGYQQWSYSYTLLPAHGGPVIFQMLQTRPVYLAAIQSCQNQFALLTGILVVLLVIAIWQLLRACNSKNTQTRMKDNRHSSLWTSYILLVISFCCLAFSASLMVKYDIYYVSVSFLYTELSTLEFIGLFIVSLGGPLILILLSIASMVGQSREKRDGREQWQYILQEGHRG